MILPRILFILIWVYFFIAIFELLLHYLAVSKFSDAYSPLIVCAPGFIYALCLNACSVLHCLFAHAVLIHENYCALAFLCKYGFVHMFEHVFDTHGQKCAKACFWSGTGALGTL
jgi:hypothetical protein